MIWLLVDVERIREPVFCFVALKSPFRYTFLVAYELGFRNQTISKYILEFIHVTVVISGVKSIVIVRLECY